MLPWWHHLHLFLNWFVQYLEELLGPILFFWIACGVSLAALVEVSWDSLFYRWNSSLWWLYYLFTRVSLGHFVCISLKFHLFYILFHQIAFIFETYSTVYRFKSCFCLFSCTRVYNLKDRAQFNYKINVNYQWKNELSTCGYGFQQIILWLWQFSECNA